jgi:hypothetical protein
VLRQTACGTIYRIVAKVETPRIHGDVKQMLGCAPEAVESFSPGHWELLCRLERDACEVVRQRDLAKAVSFFVDVAYAKRPHTTDREKARQALEACPVEVSAALKALAQAHELDYEAMEVVARLPFFGRHGGRSFNSAVLRLVCPEFFGIVDWRNVAVLCGVPGFEGLVRPAMVFPQFSQKEILDKRGYLCKDYQEWLKRVSVGSSESTLEGAIAKLEKQKPDQKTAVQKPDRAKRSNRHTMTASNCRSRPAATKYCSAQTATPGGSTGSLSMAAFWASSASLASSSNNSGGFTRSPAPRKLNSSSASC